MDSDEVLSQHRRNAAHAALLDGPATALWLLAKPAWSATCSLAGAVRFERRRWGEQLAEIKKTKVPMVHATTPLKPPDHPAPSAAAETKAKTKRQTNPCTIELVQLIDADACEVPNETFGDGVIKFRVRRLHKIHPGSSDQLVARMTFAGGMSTIMGHTSVSKALTALWKTVSVGQDLTRKKIALLLGYESKAYEMYCGDRGKSRGGNDASGSIDSKNTSEGWQVTPWQEAAAPGGNKDIGKPDIAVNIQRSRGGGGKRGKAAAKAAVAALVNENDNLRSSIHRDEFTAVYACMWRILVGAHLHLAAFNDGAAESQRHEQKQKQKGKNKHASKKIKQSNDDSDLMIQGKPTLTPRGSNKVPGKRPLRDSGNWFGLNSDYCLHAASAASVDFHIFSHHPHKEMSKHGFFNCILAVAELWIPRRSTEHVTAFLHGMNASIIAFLKSPHNAIGYRNFPGPLVFESRTMQNALQSVNNLGYPRGYDYRQSMGRNRSREQHPRIQMNSSLSAQSWREGIVGGGSIQRTRSDRRLSYYQQVGSNGHTPSSKGRGKGSNNQERPSDHYLRHKTSSFSFGRRTPITVMDNAKDNPGPGQYSPWSQYPFMDPFGAPGSSKGFPFDASSGRESLRSQEMARRRAVAATEGALDSRLLPQELCYSKLNSHNLSNRRMSFLGGGATGGRGGASISRSLYDAERIRLEREKNKDWKSRRAHTAAQNQKRRNRVVRGRLEWGLPEPLSVAEFEKREHEMTAPGLRYSMRIPQKKLVNHPLVSPVRRPKESMSTLCHPGKYTGARGDSSFVKQDNRHGTQTIRIERSSLGKTKQKIKPRPLGTESRPPNNENEEDEAIRYYRKKQEKAAVDQLLEFEEEDGESETEILWNENEDFKCANDEIASAHARNGDCSGEREIKKDSSEQDTARRRSHIAMTALRFISDQSRSRTAPVIHTRSNENTNIQSMPFPRATDLFEERDDGSIPRDLEWQQQRSSAHAMMQAFCERDDMKKHMTNRNPYHIHGHKNLSACRTDAENAWSRELRRTQMEARVRGGLEKVLLKRAARKKSREERLKNIL